MPIIPHRSNYSILDEQRGQTSPFLSLISNSIYIYIYNRPCKLKNLRTRKSNAYCITFFPFQRNFPLLLPSIFPHFFNIHPRVPLLAPSIFLLILNLLPRSKFAGTYTGQRENFPNCFAVVGSLFVIR